MIKLLNTHNFKMIKAYDNREVWEKNGKSLTIPTIHDTLNLRLAKQLKYKIMSY